MTLKECFLGFVHVTDLSGAGLADAIITFAKKVGLNLAYLRGQGYDGSSAMSGTVEAKQSSCTWIRIRVLLGKFNGVQAHIKRLVTEKAIFTHCAAHSFNLACTSSASIQGIKDAVDTIQDTIFFFTYSPKRIHLLEQVQTHSQVSNARRPKLIQLCKTRYVKSSDEYRHMHRLSARMLIVAGAKDTTQLSAFWRWSNHCLQLYLASLQKEEMLERR